MKKIILLLVLSVSLFSCSKDDAAPQNNKIVGRWILTESKTLNTTTNEVVIDTPECGVEISFTGPTSGTYTEKISAKNANGICELAQTRTATWTNPSVGVYKLKYPTDTVEDTYIIEYSNNDKTIIITQNDGPEIVNKASFLKIN